MVPHWPRAGLSGCQPGMSSGAQVSAPHEVRIARSTSAKDLRIMRPSFPKPTDSAARRPRRRTDRRDGHQKIPQTARTRSLSRRWLSNSENVGSAVFSTPAPQELFEVSGPRRNRLKCSNCHQNRGRSFPRAANAGLFGNTSPLVQNLRVPCGRPSSPGRTLIFSGEERFLGRMRVTRRSVRARKVAESKLTAKQLFGHARKCGVCCSHLGDGEVAESP